MHRSSKAKGFDENLWDLRPLRPSMIGQADFQVWAELWPQKYPQLDSVLVFGSVEHKELRAYNRSSLAVCIWHCLSTTVPTDLSQIKLGGKDDNIQGFSPDVSSLVESKYGFK